MKRIGILGGSFDPIHYGHLRLAIEATEFFQLDQLRWIPCLQQVHKTPHYANAAARLEMIALAIKNEPRFTIDDQEIVRNTPSYTLDTVRHLRQQFPKDALFLILGADSFLQLHTWEHWESLRNYVHLAIASRPHHTFSIATLTPELKNHVLQYHVKEPSNTLCGDILFFTIAALPISATELRNYLQKKKSIRYLVPDSVYDYINQYHLYESET